MFLYKYADVNVRQLAAAVKPLNYVLMWRQKCGWGKRSTEVHLSSGLDESTVMIHDELYMVV